MKPIPIVIAGSTSHTVQCAQALLEDDLFLIPWVLTPSPKKIGRKKQLTKNPFHLWAEKNNIPVILVDKKLDEQVKKQISNLQSPISFLLVVDFGYLIPNWLLQLPTIAPVNIHPSELPKYRGSSPGQFVLLYGEKESAVSMIIMNEELDEGDLIYQEKFSIPNTISLNKYYSDAFDLVAKSLASTLSDFATGKITPQPQPADSPTPIARRLTRDDGFIAWNTVKPLLMGTHLPLGGRTQARERVTREGKNDIEKNQPQEKADQPLGETSSLLLSAYHHHSNWPQTLENAIHAFTPWPGVWTIVPTNKGAKRLKILEIKIISPFMERTSGDSQIRVAEDTRSKTGPENDKTQRVELTKVQLEGLQPTSFEEVKNQIKNM